MNLRSFLSFSFGDLAELDILYPLGHLNTILRLAAEHSIPNHKPKIKLKQKPDHGQKRSIKLSRNAVSLGGNGRKRDLHRLICVSDERR